MQAIKPYKSKFQEKKDYTTFEELLNNIYGKYIKASITTNGSQFVISGTVEAVSLKSGSFRINSKDCFGTIQDRNIQEIFYTSPKNVMIFYHDGSNIMLYL